MRHWLRALRTWFVHEWQRLVRCPHGESPPDKRDPPRDLG